ncbi:MAG TPA: hypothetical protein VGJ84_17090 [Polyangiaceae bacterium]
MFGSSPFRIFRLLAVPACVFFGTLGCGGGDDATPIPDQFDAPFIQGTVCAPTEANTGTGPDTNLWVPFRFDTCLYRCVGMAPPQMLQYLWSCAGPLCQMTVLATTHMVRVKSEQGCDGRNLIDPPPGECTQTSVAFQVPPPFDTGQNQFLANYFTVVIPYMSMAQAATLEDALRAMQPFDQALASVGPLQRYPQREFQMHFDPANPKLGDASLLTGADCHNIPLP